MTGQGSRDRHALNDALALCLLHVPFTAARRSIHFPQDFLALGRCRDLQSQWPKGLTTPGIGHDSRRACKGMALEAIAHTRLGVVIGLLAISETATMHLQVTMCVNSMSHTWMVHCTMQAKGVGNTRLQMMTRRSYERMALEAPQALLLLQTIMLRSASLNESHALERLERSRVR